MSSEGQRLSHFRLMGKLGQGAMGVVYRAHDERLQRDVALKLLPATSVGDERARARLLREARMASALSHPNVCTIFEADEADGRMFIAMELVEGDTLDRIVPREGLPAQAVCRYGAQIADALDHAHRKSVVHRDLKLSNVMVTPSGHLKVLDFGLSRRETGPESEGSSTASLTSIGTVVGTPLYLAPEVWRGERADERSDIWALGVVLYQLACGKPPFRGATAHELSAAIQHRPPDPLPERVPLPIVTLIHRCLEKDPRQRIRSAAEVRASLEILAPDPTRPLARRRLARFRWMAAAAFVLLALGLGFMRLHWPRPGPPTAMRHRQLTFNSAENAVVAAAISPDGKILAYADRQGLFVRQIETGDVHALAAPRGWKLEMPFAPSLEWSRDGLRLMVSFPAGSLWEIPVMGGNPRLVRNGSWEQVLSPDGRRMASVGDSARALIVSDLDGGRADTVLMLRAAGSWGPLDAPTWSPDGQWLAFVFSGSRTMESQIRGLDGGSADMGSGRLGPVGRSLYCLNVRSRRLTRAVTDSLLNLNAYGANHQLCWLPGDRLVYARGEARPNDAETNLWFVKLDPRTRKGLGPPRRLTERAGEFVGHVTASADGRRLAFLTWRTQTDIYVSDFEDRGSRLGLPRRLTLDDGQDLLGGWSPDGKTVLFTSDRGGTPDLYRQRLDESTAERLIGGPESERLVGFAPDDSALYYISDSRSGALERRRLMRLSLADGEARPMRESSSASRYAWGTRSGSPGVESQLEGHRLVFFELGRAGARGPALASVDSVTDFYYAWSLAPAGSRVLLLRYRGGGARCTLLDLKTGTARDLPFGDGLNSAVWASESDLICTGTLERTGEDILFRSNLSGERKVLLTTSDDIFGSIPSPDGRHVAFTRTSHASTVWLLEGF